MKKSLLFTIILSFFFISTAHSTDYWFSQSGNDSALVNSENTPWQTLSKLNSIEIDPGDRILFKKDDTWIIGPDENGILINFDGTETEPVIITGYGSGNMPVIDASAQTGDNSRSGTAENCIYINAGKGDYVTIDALDLRGAQGELVINGYGNECADYLTIQNCKISGSGFSSEGMVNLYGGTGRIIRNNDFFAEAGYNKGLELSDTNNSLISSNRLYDAMSGGGGIRLVFGYSNIVENNYISGASPGQSYCWAIVVRSIHEGTDPWVILRNNIINAYGVTSNPRGITGWDDEIHRSPSGKKTYVLNNTVFGGGNGEAVKMYDTGWVVKNNIFVNWETIYDQCNADVVVEISNNAHSLYTILKAIEQPDNFTDLGSHIDSSPLIAAPLSPDSPDDFKLLEDSPCINRGVSGPFFPTSDFWGSSRTDSDIGANEFKTDTSSEDTDSGEPVTPDSDENNGGQASDDSTCFISSARE